MNAGSGDSRSTIREHIRRKVWLAISVAFAGVIVLEGIMSFARANYLLVLAPLLVIVPMYIAYWTIRCPRCWKRFGTALSNRIAFPLFAGRVSHCPFCSANLDEPLSRDKSS